MKLKYKNKLWVAIRKCESATAWYANKIGTIQRVTDDLFPPDYTLIEYKRLERVVRGVYPMLNHEDAELINPSIMDKFKIWLGFRVNA